MLISNDDGIRARGIRVLADRLQDLGDVVVVAPDRERSAQSHAISLDRPLRVTEIRPSMFAVDGTPADCVYLGLLHLAPRRPDLVVSGINHGYNLGSDFFYSGTVAAAVEGAIRGFPAFAISMEVGPEDGFVAAAELAHALAHAIFAEGLPRKTLLNVNVPNHGPLRGYRWTRLGERVYRDQVEARTDLRGRRYFWIGGPALDAQDVAGSDSAAVRESIVSLTPLDLDLTSHGLLGSLPGWRLPGFEAILEEEAPGASS
ncbi:MAG: 5'/3'-nucleotidase SurE [Deltaproteobacteria bacterium]|nr:5'/3'-nucleotidase SurE [Deltaproteobacteria bacterium]